MPDRVERARGANRNLGERKNFQRFPCQNSSSPMLRTNVTPGKELCFLERKRKFTPFLYSALVQFLSKNSNFERDNNRVEDSMSLFKILLKQISTKRQRTLLPRKETKDILFQKIQISIIASKHFDVSIFQNVSIHEIHELRNGVSSFQEGQCKNWNGKSKGRARKSFICIVGRVKLARRIDVLENRPISEREEKIIRNFAACKCEGGGSPGDFR